MAGDGMMNAGGMITDHSYPKVFRLKDGRLMGCCGLMSDARPFMAWLDDPESERPKLDDSFAALVLCPDGSLRWYESNGNYTDQSVPMAIGSGSPYALAAMDVGETAEQAVARAIHRDTCTGGEITVMHLEQAALRAA